MRITNDNFFRTVLSDVTYLQYQQLTLDKQIATGHVVNAPSDAPSVSVTIMDSRILAAETAQYVRNLDVATKWLDASESSMQSIKDLLDRAKTLAEKMATGTYSKAEQIGSATEVQNILQEIMVLANTKMEGSYIFSGSLTGTAPINSLLVADPAPVLVTDTSPGHDTQASLWQDLDGNWHLRLARSSGVGSSATVGLTADNTLGDSVGLDFDWPGQWSVTQTASDSPERGQIVTSNSTVGSTVGLVSNLVGESLSWSPTTTVGVQTYRTDGVLTVSGGVTVDVVFAGGPTHTYDASSASELVDLINSAAHSEYFAWLEGSDTVHIVSTGSTFSLADNGSPPGNLSIDQDTNMSELVDEINSGLKAAGVLHLAGPPPANFQPGMDQTVTVGSYTWTWGQITSDTTLASAGDYANALANWINQQTDAYTASTVFSGSSASVQILARAVGAEGNTTIASSNTTITTSGALYGGLDGTGLSTTGKIYGTGTSDLRLGTQIRATVLSASGSTVSLRLRWFDDDGVLQTQDVDLTDSGDGHAVAVTGMGGLSIYRDDGDFYEGAVFTLDITHYQGNDEDLEVNFSESGGRMPYNYTARQILGDNMTTSLMNQRASARDNSGDGSVMLTGAYRGLLSREITFDVLDDGQVPGDNVKFRVSWKDDDGIPQSQEVALRGVGVENGIVLPLTGKRPQVDLSGQVPTADAANTGTGVVRLAGTYSGLGSRHFQFTCTNDGSAAGDDLTLRVTWTDDQGIKHQEDVEVPKSGQDNEVEIPGSEGVYLYVDDTTTFAVGDNYTYDLDLYPDNMGEGVFFHIDNGSFRQGDSFFYKIDKQPLHVIDSLKQWRQQLLNGSQEEGQTASQRTLAAIEEFSKSIMDLVAGAGTRQSRIDVRNTVLTDNKLYASQNLETFQDVDVTKAFLELRNQQTAYTAALKSISIMTYMSLVNMI